MRSPWQLIMWKRKQFNKGQTRFENRLGVGGGGCKVGRAEQRRGRGGGEMERWRDGGGGRRERGAGGATVCGCAVAAPLLVSPPAVACEGSVSVPRTPQ